MHKQRHASTRACTSIGMQARMHAQAVACKHTSTHKQQQHASTHKQHASTQARTSGGMQAHKHVSVRATAAASKRAHCLAQASPGAACAVLMQGCAARECKGARRCYGSAHSADQQQ